MTDFLKIIHELATVFPAFVLVLTFRGFFRAAAARLMGDYTSSEAGFFTLNPVAHIDVFGLSIILFALFVLGAIVPSLFLIVLLMMFGVRWNYEVPINEFNFKHTRKGIITTALAGPIGNLFLALLFLYIIAYFPAALVPKNIAVPLLQICHTVVQFSIFFALFHLIPLPPFDGGILVMNLLPPSWFPVRQWLEENSFFMILALLVIMGVGMNFIGYWVLFIERLLSYLVI